jgi:hypothetical protein
MVQSGSHQKFKYKNWFQSWSSLEEGKKADQTRPLSTSYVSKLRGCEGQKTRQAIGQEAAALHGTGWQLHGQRWDGLHQAHIQFRPLSQQSGTMASGSYLK